MSGIKRKVVANNTNVMMVKKPSPRTQLTGREESLCQAYLIANDQSDAYRKSDYSSTEMSPVSINKAASALFNKPHISSRVAELMKERIKRLGVDADYVLRRLVEIDQLDLLDIMNDDLSIKPLSEWPKAWRATVTNIDVLEQFESDGGDRVSSGVIKKLKFPDKVKNLELLGRHVNVQSWKEKSQADLDENATLPELMRRIIAERELT